jgi:hypothetical protein
MQTPNLRSLGLDITGHLMLNCPHCAAPITHADLRSQRLFRPRTCKACSGQYFEGGTTVGLALVGAGGSLAASMPSLEVAPKWVTISIAFGCALVAVCYTHFVPPRKMEELRSRFVQAVIAAVVAGALVWKIVSMATS